MPAKACARTILGCVLAAAAWSQGVEEYRVKAAFLFNFAKFVEWPPMTFKTSGDPIQICMLGENMFGNALEEAVSGKTVDGRTFLVRHITSPNAAGGCQILFISASERKRLHETLCQIRSEGVLTVGETDNFTTEGGIINFRIENGRVSLQVNVEAAGQAKLRISSKLLSLAQIVKR